MQLQEATQCRDRGDLSGLYKVVRSLTPWKPRQRTQLQDPSGRLLDFTQALKTYFSGLFAPLHLAPTHARVPPVLPNSPALIAKQLSTLKIGKAVPPLSAPTAVWTCCAEIIAPTLAQYIDQSLPLQSSMPSGWTDAHLALLPKPQKPSNLPENLRSIGLIRPDGKSIAGALKETLMPQVKTQLNTVPQFAYLSERDITDCLLRVNTCIAQTLQCAQSLRRTRFAKREQVEAGTYNPTEGPELEGCIILSIDLSKAFDMVDKGQLEISLRKAGATAQLTAAILKLHATAQYHVTSGAQTSGIRTKRGIRQGCRLAPTLWSILSSQLLKDMQAELNLPHLDAYTAFADDTPGHWRVSSSGDLESFTAQALALLRLLQRYGLKLNEDKSQLMFRLQGRAAAKVLKGRIVQHQKKKMLAST